MQAYSRCKAPLVSSSTGRSCVLSTSRCYARRAICRSDDEKREIGCSELYNMTQAIGQADANDPLSRISIRAAPTPVEPGRAPTLPPSAPSAATHGSGGPPPASNTTAAAVPASAPTSQPATPMGAKPAYGAEYYKGLVTSGLTQDNGASGADMLKRSLQLAGGMAALLGALTYGFLASNGLV